MMDDVVGLVMVNIVTTLGKGRPGGWPIARPIAASFGLLLVTLAICPYMLRPVWRWLLGVLRRGAQLDAPTNSKPTLRTTIPKLIREIPHLSFILSTLVLIIFVTIASFIDASVLFAAFIAGGVVSFLWALRNEQQQSESTSGNGPAEMYEEYYKPVMEYILVPFFFVSLYSTSQPQVLLSPLIFLSLL
jgi:Kef-type K+ transport system membrane component KefB